MSTHTPGPWEWQGHALMPVNGNPDIHAVHTILEVENFAYGFVFSKQPDVAREDDANAHLIAAAPDLLAAARVAHAIFARQKWVAGSTAPEAIAMQQLAAAIAKAEGRSC